jgi:hypothetical protein
MNLYHYDEASGVLLWVDNARLDTLESERQGTPVFVVPALATTIAPPSDVPEGHIAFFDYENEPQEWKIVEIAAPVDPETPPNEEPVSYTIGPISKRQFWQEIAMIGWISKTEALAFMQTGALPEAFEAALATLDFDTQWAARMALAANEYERNDAFVGFFEQLFDKTDEQVDAVWISAGAQQIPVWE